MQLKKYIAPIIAVIIISSCTPTKQLTQLKTDAQAAFTAADYQTAFTAFDSIITLNTSRGKAIDGQIYRSAGISAWEIGQTQKTLDYLEKAKEMNAADGKVYFTLAKAYLKIDNLSREIINLDEYIAKYPQGNELQDVRCQLYLAYVRSTNWDLAQSLWNSLGQTCKESPKVLEAYLQMLQQGNNSKLIIITADKILKIDKGNTVALEALAVGYYNTAESSYQIEMREYQKNKTNKQYKQLLKALKLINADFQKSSNYFEQLYKINPDPRYANYLGNIYTRFENKKKADYYYRKAKE